MLAIAGCSEDNTHPKVSPVDEPSADAVTILATIDAIPSATGDGEAYAPLWQEGDQIIVGYKGKPTTPATVSSSIRWPSRCPRTHAAK